MPPTMARERRVARNLRYHPPRSGRCQQVTSSAVDHILLDRVRDLRTTGLTAKQIARTLGLRPAAIAPLVRAVAEEAAEAQREPAVVGCWVSPGWSQGLRVHGHEDWPDVAVADDGHGGMACVVVARRHRPHRVSVCGYLVDTQCLGVKNALGPRTMSDSALPEFVHMFFGAFAEVGAPLEAPLDLARHLVWGSIAAARRLGFEPDADFAPAAGHLGAWAEDSAIAFGRDGVPFYVQGPYDDAAAIFRTLTESVGEGNFHFLMTADTALAW